MLCILSGPPDMMGSLSHVLHVQNEQICGNSLLAAVLKHVSCYVCNTFVISVISHCGNKVPDYSSEVAARVAASVDEYLT